MRRYFHTLVVGSGPAGIAAATRAAEAGRSVGLVDDNPAAGGQIWRAVRGLGELDVAHAGSGAGWYRRLVATTAERLQGWSIFSQSDEGRLLAESQTEQATLELSFETLVLATGARERFLPFPGWTLPNVMGVGGLQAMVKAGLPMEGKRVVVAGSGPLLLAVAAVLRKAGAKVVCIAEQAPLSQLTPFAIGLLRDPGKLVQGMRYRRATRGTPFHTSCWPVEAKGDTGVRTVVLSRNGKRDEIACDYLACGFHLVPNTELAELLGCEVRNGAVTVDELQRTRARGVFCAGEPTGIGGLERSLRQGEIAGLAAAGRIDEAATLAQRSKGLQHFSERLAKAFALRPELRGLAQADTLVCRCEDVPFSAVQRETSWRAAKLHTRCGMGPCQGRICGAATNFLFGWEEYSVRPPVLPARVASLGCVASVAPLQLTDKPEIP